MNFSCVSDAPGRARTGKLARDEPGARYKSSVSMGVLEREQHGSN